MSRPIVLLLTVLVLLGGCSAATDGQGSNPDAEAPPAIPSPSPTPTGPVYDLPLDAKTVVAAHNESLRAAGSFTAETNVTTSDDETGQILSVRASTAVDTGHDTMLLTGESGGLAGVSVYVGPDGAAYQRVELETGEPRYQALPTAPEADTYVDLPVAALIEQATFTAVGRSRLDGTSVSVYEAVELETLVAPEGVSAVETGRIQAFDVRLVIDDDGIIRQFDYHVTVEVDGSTRTVAVSVAFRDIGTTVVEAPDWIDEVG